MSVLLSQGHISNLNNLLRGRPSYMIQWDFYKPFLDHGCTWLRGKEKQIGLRRGLFFIWLLGSTWWPVKMSFGGKKNPKPCILKKSGNGGEWSWYRPLLLSGCFPRESSQRVCSLYIGAGFPDCLHAGCSTLTSSNRDSCWGNACFHLSKQCILTWLERFLECCWIDNFELLPVLEFSRVLLF